MTAEMFNQVLKSKKERLENSVSLEKDNYLRELNRITFCSEKQIFVLPDPYYTEQFNSADFVAIEDEGDFYEIAHIYKFPFDDYYIAFFRQI